MSRGDSRIDPTLGRHVLRFGQHKGKQIDDVPLKYLKRLLGWSDLWDSDRVAIKAYLEQPAIAAELDKELH